MAVGRNHGMNNQEGTLTPQHSAWGQAMLNGLSTLYAQPAPIGKKVFGVKGYYGNIGGVITRAANVQGLQVNPGYSGDLPQSEQAKVQAPPPWNRF